MDRLAALQSRPELAGLHLVSGDITRAADLERAGAARAGMALILADEGDPAPDSRTLLAVMAFRQLNKEAHLCAEVREQRFVRYVQDAGADELIDPGAFRRAMAAQILVSPGMGNVFYDLLRFDKGAFFGFEEIPSGLIGLTFADLERRYLEREGVMLVGLVENVGSPLQIKREALREAQKTPDVSHLVNRLREAKDVQPHHPVLCPSAGHVLRARSLAVVVRRTQEESA
jgi:voltage-gated potassium channel